MVHVHYFSNNWNDLNSDLGLDSRSATATEVNAAFISGIVPTDGGTYSGGLENYPRMHEKWSGVVLLIRGSFSSLWNSQIATGQWAYGDPYYSAPIRNWFYDTDLASEANLPPQSPFVVEVERVAVWVGEAE